MCQEFADNYSRLRQGVAGKGLSCLFLSCTWRSCANVRAAMLSEKRFCFQVVRNKLLELLRVHAVGPQRPAHLLGKCEVATAIETLVLHFRGATDRTLGVTKMLNTDSILGLGD